MFKTEIKSMDLKELKPFPGNPQELSPEMMAEITAAMQTDGWYAEWPLVWDTSFNRKIKGRNKYIIAGNHRVKCAIEAGITDHECIVITDPKYNWERASRDCIALNSRKGAFNEDLLKDFINNMITEFDLDIERLSGQIGLSEEEIKALLDGYIVDEKIKEKEIDESMVPVNHECPRCGYKWS